MKKKAIIPLLFLQLLSYLLPIQGEILFQSDLERGETHIAAPLKPGARKILLYKNHLTEEWPIVNGHGIVEGNLVTAKEHFTYSRRDGHVLKGVRGINKPHPKGCDIRTGNMDAWTRERGVTATGNEHIGIHSRNPISGNYSLEFEPSPTFSCFGVSLSASRSLYVCRFLVRFTDELLEDPSLRLPLCFFNFNGNPIQEVLLSRRGDPSAPQFSLSPRSSTVNLIEKAGPPLPVEKDRVYEIEFSARTIDSSTVEVTLKVDKDIRLLLRSVYSMRSPDLPSGMRIGRVGNETTPGSFQMDEIIVSDSTIPSRPLQPGVSLEGNSFQIASKEDTRGNLPVTASHWQIAESNSWLLPLFNSGRDTIHRMGMDIPYTITLSGTINDIENDAIEPPLHIPTGIRAQTTYFARVRQQNQAESWSEWSEPIRFEAPQRPSQPKASTGLPTIEQVFVSEVGKRKPLREIVPEKWYDIHMHVTDEKGWNNLLYADLFLHAQPQNCEANYYNRGGSTDPHTNYGLTFTLENGGIITRIGKKWFQTVDIIHPSDLYVMDKDGSYIRYSKNWLKTRIRLLGSARKGVWLISGYAKNRDNRLSPMYKDLILVSEPGQDTVGFPHIWYWAIILMLLLALVVSWIAPFSKTKSRSDDKADDTSQEPIVGSAADASERIQRSLLFMQQNYQTIDSTKQVADEVKLSPKYFGRIFAKEIGTTAADYLNEIRIAQAKKLLKETDYNVAEIAQQVGYSTPEYFASVFRTLEGTSPRDFRKS